MRALLGCGALPLARRCMARKTVKRAKPKKRASPASKAKPKPKLAKKPTSAQAKARRHPEAKPRAARTGAKAAKKRAAPAAKKRTTAARTRARTKTAARGAKKAKTRPAATRARPAAKPKVKRPVAKRVVVPKWMERMRGVLEVERDRLTDRLKDVGNFSNDGKRGAGAEIATTDDDTIDMASQAVERERELALRSNLEDLLERVQKALIRIDQAEYGVCERCGEKISRERLKAVPHATMCLRCRAIIDG